MTAQAVIDTAPATELQPPAPPPPPPSGVPVRYPAEPDMGYALRLVKAGYAPSDFGIKLTTEPKRRSLSQVLSDADARAILSLLLCLAFIAVVLIAEWAYLFSGVAAAADIVKQGITALALAFGAVTAWYLGSKANGG